MPRRKPTNPDRAMIILLKDPQNGPTEDRKKEVREDLKAGAKIIRKKAGSEGKIKRNTAASVPCLCAAVGLVPFVVILYH